jgi:hypothetical protein
MSLPAPRSNDVRQLLARQQQLQDQVAHIGPDSFGGCTHLLCVTTTVTTYPTTANVFYGLIPQALLGTESEGAAGVLTPGTIHIFGLNLGASVPPPGTQVLAEYVGNRWVFRYG